MDLHDICRVCAGSRAKVPGGFTSVSKRREQAIVPLIEVPEMGFDFETREK